MLTADLESSRWVTELMAELLDLVFVFTVDWDFVSDGDDSETVVAVPLVLLFEELLPKLWK